MAQKKKKAAARNASHSSSAGRYLVRPALISLGLMAFAEEQVSSALDTLTKRGEKVRKSGAKYFRKLIEEGQEHFEEQRERMKEEVGESRDLVPRLLHWLNIPTRDDIERLDKRVDALLKRVA